MKLDRRQAMATPQVGAIAELKGRAPQVHALAGCGELCVELRNPKLPMVRLRRFASKG